MAAEIFGQELGPSADPAFALQKVHEHQASEQTLGEGVQLVGFVRVLKFAHAAIVRPGRCAQLVVVRAVFGVEAARHHVHIERFSLRFIDLAARSVMGVDRVERIQIVPGRIGADHLEFVHPDVAFDRRSGQARIDEYMTSR